MKRYSVTVNGKVYDVVVDELGASQAAPAAAPAPVPAPAPAAPAAPAPAPTPAPAAAPAPVPVSGGDPINAPMPGNILDVRVKDGDQVTKGQVICILEAMKMENEIMSPKDGTVAGMRVKMGDTVNSNDPICNIL